ncbi:MAG: permease-like cell division protein FtsX [bacterium]|jgi:cell division transport system permease protein
MKLRTFRRLGREAWTSLRRNNLMSLASIGTVFITLLTLGLFLLLVNNVEALTLDMEAQVEINAYLESDLSREAIDAGLLELKEMAEVSEAVYVSKDEALRELREQFGTEQDLLDAVEEINPLRDSYRIKLVKTEDAAAVAAAAGKLPGVEEVKYRQDIVEKLLRVTRIVRTLGLVLVILLLLATIFVISNTIRLTVFARRREVSIMKLVGATDWYIRWPFLLEGMFIGVVGALTSSVLLYFGYGTFVRACQQSVPFLPLLSSAELIKTTCAWLLGVGVFVGAAGSIFSLRRYLQV